MVHGPCYKHDFEIDQSNVRFRWNKAS